VFSKGITHVHPATVRHQQTQLACSSIYHRPKYKISREEGNKAPYVLGNRAKESHQGLIGRMWLLEHALRDIGLLHDL
jgi:hypothetical protein